MHPAHAFEHARRLVLSAPMILHPHVLNIPLIPPLFLQLQSGVPFELFSYPKRYSAPDALHGVHGALLFEFIIPF